MAEGCKTRSEPAGCRDRASDLCNSAQVSWAGERATSAADGSYRVELGCDRTFGFGTTAFVVSHPSYATSFGLGTRAEFLSNGGSFRRDVDLTPLGR
jgi:hypothetical protein